MRNGRLAPDRPDSVDGRLFLVGDVVAVLLAKWMGKWAAKDTATWPPAFFVDPSLAKSVAKSPTKCGVDSRNHETTTW